MIEKCEKNCEKNLQNKKNVVPLHPQLETNRDVAQSG